MINELDTQAFLWLNSLHSDSFDPIMAWITAKNSWILMYLLIIGIIIWKHKKNSIAMLLTIVISVAIADQFCSGLLKPLIHRLRPCHEPSLQNLVHLVGNCGGQFGFCSSHAANSFALATGLYLLFKNNFKLVQLFFVWAIIVSYSRIYVGVHYPLDVLTGAGIGVLSTIICHKFYQYYLTKNTHEIL